MTIANSKIKELLVEKINRVYAERTQTKSQSQFKETLVNILPIGNRAVWSEIKTVSIRFLQMVLDTLTRHEDADDSMSSGLERWTSFDKFMNALLKRIVSSPLFNWPEAGSIKQHVVSTIHEFCLTQLHPEPGKVQEKL